MTWVSPRPPSTRRPLAFMAARCAQRAMKVTSAPALARAAPNPPPTPPAPTTAIRMKPSDSGDAGDQQPSAHTAYNRLVLELDTQSVVLRQFIRHSPAIESGCADRAICDMRASSEGQRLPCFQDLHVDGNSRTVTDQIDDFDRARFQPAHDRRFTGEAHRNKG